MSDKRLEINRSLQHNITAQIKQKGAISFAQFMQMALYEPGLGYYSAGLAKLGCSGDFVTAPEMGALFARCHARCFAEVLPHLSHPTILELGAGTGQFCVDVLIALDESACLPERYAIFEISADLKQVQKQSVAQLPSHLSKRVVWLDSPPNESFEGIVFANEVLDALPVEVFKYDQLQYQRLMLTNKNGALTEQWHEFEPQLLKQLQQKELQLDAGYRSEFIPHLSAWIKSVVGQLSKGLVLMVDYGYGRSAYYHPQRSTGTLVCHQRHQANFNPYQDVGLQDITAFVDFTAVAEGMNEAGLDVVGFTTQAEFLLASGIDQWLDPDGDYQRYFATVTEMKKLVMPEEMGDKFKSIAATKNLPQELSAFKNNRLQDL
jgi:SAM-dependent MidA family methyltransferase